MSISAFSCSGQWIWWYPDYKYFDDIRHFVKSDVTDCINVVHDALRGNYAVAAKLFISLYCQ